MSPKIFLKVNRIKQREFARALGISQSHVSQIINGKRRASPEVALSIERFTNGAIHRNEMLYPQDAKED